VRSAIFAFLAVFALQAAGRNEPEPLTADPAAVNNPATTDPVGPSARGNAVIRAAILLDRAHFAPGEIDGTYGRNLQKAIVAFQKAHNIEASGTVDEATWNALNADPGPALLPYTIAPQDVAGPFEPKIPESMLAKAELPALSYTSPLEGMAETFHCNPKVLEALNPGKDFTKAGEQIMGPNVSAPYFAKAASVLVDKSDSSVTALDDGGKVLAYYPATIGSQHDPLPVGDWKITGVKRDPWFFYNASLFWDAKEKDATAKIHPGPNNPVGVVWIGLSKEHYGIHGTPEPSKIGHTHSHGCIRLTNWNASELASMVAPGTPAILKE
jgi:lipoprotein-anchoring transpeptidase ErfK/SrfK